MLGSNSPFTAEQRKYLIFICPLSQTICENDLKHKVYYYISTTVQNADLSTVHKAVMPR